MKLKDWIKKHFPDKEKELAELDEPEIQKPDTPPAAKVDTPADDKRIEKLENLVAQQMAENKKLLDEVAAFKNKEADRDKLLTEKAAAEKKQKIEDAIKKAIEDKKIPAKDDATIATYTKLFELDFDNTAKVITALPVIAGEKKPGEAKTGDGKGIEVKGPFGSVDKTILKAVNEMSAASQN